mmetsp:Transcript_13687/g.44699  ORF Transcript_13687/g.44699 Transcript_13687/m.44699 type:complete len:222 (+) Transcript_13687:1-666(+)
MDGPGAGLLFCYFWTFFPAPAHRTVVCLCHLKGHSGTEALSRNGLPNLALSVPVLAHPGGREDGQPVPHVHAVDLPQQLVGQPLVIGEVLDILLELFNRRGAEQHRGARTARPAPAQSHLGERHARMLGQAGVRPGGLLRGPRPVAIQRPAPAELVHPPARLLGAELRPRPVRVVGCGRHFQVLSGQDSAGQRVVSHEADVLVPRGRRLREPVLLNAPVEH